jgi:hypothetical protein
MTKNTAYDKLFQGYKGQLPRGDVVASW